MKTLYMTTMFALGIACVQATPWNGNSPQYQNYNNQYRATGYNPNAACPQQNNYYSNSYSNSMNQMPVSSDGKYSPDIAAQDSDRRINDKIREKATGWLADKYKNIRLNTVNGVVTAIGYVNNNDDLIALIGEIRKVDGVKYVNVHINIANASSAPDQSRMQTQSTSDKYPQDRALTEDDRRLNDQIRNKFSGWLTDSYKNVILNTANGYVVITGYVFKTDDLNKLQNEIRNMDGVRNVTNNAQVRNPG